MGIYRQTPTIQKAPTGQDWNLSVGAVGRNLDRAASGRYGGRYGMKPTTGLYEARMAQIKGNFAAKQAQSAEEQRRREADKGFMLQARGIGETKRSNRAAEALRQASEARMAGAQTWLQETKYPGEMGFKEDELAKTYGFKESELAALKDYRAQQADQWDRDFGMREDEAKRMKDLDEIRQEQWEKEFGLKSGDYKPGPYGSGGSGGSGGYGSGGSGGQDEYIRRVRAESKQKQLDAAARQDEDIKMIRANQQDRRDRDAATKLGNRQQLEGIVKTREAKDRYERDFSRRMIESDRNYELALMSAETQKEREGITRAREEKRSKIEDIQRLLSRPGISDRERERLWDELDRLSR